MPETHRFLIMTTDPVHIGTGGMRLGRVDNTIVREPGTNLPKIPGTALHGAIRAYAARRYGKPQCAGRGGREGRKHCGRPTCPICYTFGSVQGEAGSFSGVVSISDARILLFPVYSMVGPVWVTSPGVLEDAGLGNNFTVSPDKAKWDGNGELPTDKPINLGWLMVEREDNFPSIQWPDEIPAQIRNRVVLVSDKLFSQIVNSNLEVRTSVAINPETGAAEEHALFTYEAIPRATVLWFDVVLDDFRNSFPSTAKLTEWEQVLDNGGEDEKKRLLKKRKVWPEKEEQDKVEEAISRAKSWIAEEKYSENGETKWKWTKMGCQNGNETILCLINSALEWAEHLGIGGMGTRGFGRIKKIYCDPVEVKNEQN
ncbi:RAMP superfamily CRISPR-associated protein [Thermodesulfatator autotrophicus]|uniref:RAMP superfamily CRISPR-associated protein n=1 Tax=Thermodesulfatator autotrophicus TaxID=1795632 RepID=UPI000837BC77|nr:RAMP superfamily CRISPR-associated protein [Thermodesulfatator autotrophicus]